MAQERFEWLEIPDAPQPQRVNTSKTAEPVLGKRCPQCGWLDEETAIQCFRCGYRYNVDRGMAERIGQLGVTLPPRVIDAGQNLENFFRIYGRTRLPEPLDIYQLRQRGIALQLAQGFDKLLCLEEIAVEHYQHQIDAALRALHQMRGRALLADEVGLGKTIEAGIVMKELIQRGLVRTVLVLTPASLTEQWREELQTKFHESFTVMETPQQWTAVQDADAGRWIVSLDRAKLDQHSAAVLGREYDLLIVDEAHKLKNRATRAWQFVNKVRKRYVLMLTATPVQNDLMELYSLITILSPGQLGTVRAFRRNFVEHADARHPKNAASLRRLLNDVMIRNRRSKVDIQFPKRQAAVYHLELSEPEWMLYSDVTDYIRRRFKDRDSDKHLRLTLMTLQKELSSSPQALAHTLRKMVADRAHGDNVRAEMQRFLALAESIPTSRKLRAVREILARYPGKFLIFTEYRQTQEAIIADLQAQGISAVAFHGGMDIRQKEEAIAAFRDGLPADEGDNGKTGKEVVPEPDSPTRRGRRKRAAKETRRNIRVLVSTESGAEGRNLQFCHQLINYDLPWNPMRVEQRIGRLHRLGQEQDVTIFNLSCNETIEAHVIDLLARKIRMFELVIGELDLILGNLEGNKSFEDLLREAWETATDDEDLATRIHNLGDLLSQARREYERVRQNNARLDAALDL
jgi:SNF2 family DNA or RNA helicase